MENSKVLAKVGDVEITEDIVNKTIESLRPEQRAYFETETGKKQLLDNLVNMELINAEGEKMGIPSSDLFRTEMERMQKDLLMQITLAKVMEDINLTDEDVEKEMAENADAYRESESFGAKHILVEDEAFAKEIKGKIDSGEMTFEEAAMEYSTCPSSEKGGDLGSFGRGMMVPEFEKATEEAEMGKVTDPVKTQFGYHLIDVYQKGADRNLVKNTLLQKKQMERYNSFVSDLRKKAGF